MSGVNIVALSGRLGKDPELKYFEDGGSVSNFSIAVDIYAGKDKENRTLWMNCKAYNQRAEFIAEHYSKGEKVMVSGNLDTRSWTNENGEKRKETFMVVNQIDKEWPKKEDQ